MTSRAEIFKDAFENHPRSMWLKKYDGDKFTMIAVNRAFVYHTGINNGQYQGLEDSEFFSTSEAEQFNDNDLKVVLGKKKIRTAEVADHPISGKKLVWVGYKWPQLDANNRVIGVYGCADPWPIDMWELLSPSIKEMMYNN